jgi:hypothetical protein
MLSRALQSVVNVCKGTAIELGNHVSRTKNKDNEISPEPGDFLFAPKVIFN